MSRIIYFIPFRLLDMNYILAILFVCTLGSSYAQEQPTIRLNHLMLVVDSTTFTSLRDSPSIEDQFWFKEEKELKYWAGLYIIGENNYLEIFHQNSMKEEVLDVGENWTCYASMKSEYVNSLAYDSTCIQFEENEYFKFLSLELNNELSPFQVWEMNQLQYETWTKKEFESGMSFEPYDYNSKAESDSSKQYLFDDVIGVTYTIPSADSDRAIGFFKSFEYSILERTRDSVTFDNGAERITLIFKDEINTVLINSLELKLNKDCPKEELSIGTSTLKIDGNTAIWSFDRSTNE